MTPDEEKRIAFKISRYCHVRPCAVEIFKDKTETLEDGRRKIVAKVQSHQVGVLMEGEYIISMWYEVF